MARDHDDDAQGIPDPTNPPPASAPPTEAPAAGHDATTGAATAARTPPRTLDARTLLGDGRVLHIEHGGEIYTLRITRNDRLILTK